MGVWSHVSASITARTAWPHLSRSTIFTRQLEGFAQVSSFSDNALPLPASFETPPETEKKINTYPPPSQKKPTRRRRPAIAPSTVVGAKKKAATVARPGHTRLKESHERLLQTVQDLWGEDKLRPPVSSSATSTTRFGIKKVKAARTRAPDYTRRVEGVLEDTKNGSILQEIPPIFEHQPIAKLSHDLDRVLFNPGVHWLQDPRSRVYNFTPWLENIPKVSEFAFERLSGFTPSSRDEELWALAKQEKRTFGGSTSSLSGMLSQIYFLISGDKEVDTSILSQVFQKEPKTFTAGQRMASSVTFNYSDGVYAIDSAGDKKDVAERNILTWLGTLLEKFLTMPREQFSTYMRSDPQYAAPSEPELVTKEAFRYSKTDRFVLRSQLDCNDPRLPGTGVFDIKTRACLPIRLDILNYEENSGYLIRSQHGLVESFEREYYDLIRSAFLKYGFQARIGNMDGVLVAYHNTSRMFGFQYIPLREMDERLFGPSEGVGDRVFNHCIRILESVAEEITRCFPNQSVKCTFETREASGVMDVFVQPVGWEGPGDGPIKQLQVHLVNYVDGSPVSGHRAVSTPPESSWQVHWKVSLLQRRQDRIRAALAEVTERQYRAFNLPSGVDIEQMAEFWENLNFSGSPMSTEKGDYNPSAFRPAGRSIKTLRAMARAGREHSDRLVLEEAGKPKFVLGQAEPTHWNELVRPTVLEAGDVTPEEWVDNALSAIEQGLSPESVLFADSATDRGQAEGDEVDTQGKTSQTEGAVIFPQGDLGESGSLLNSETPDGRKSTNGVFSPPTPAETPQPSVADADNTPQSTPHPSKDGDSAENTKA